ncbi:MAG: response regulator [Desulfobacula sp.]|nr:response regulator [Desulfobacula sp.]
MNNPIPIALDFPITDILIVDDDPALRLVVSRSLERAGFVCQQAQDAFEALELIKINDFHLVISDISMPGGMDGIDLLKTIKDKYQDIYVIIMTGFGSDYSYVDIMDAGASDYMTKPFNMNSALARINRIAREKINLLNLKKSNQELCRAIERSNILAREAKEASKAKTFFLASMSHEIRTPLNGIVGYTDMLMDTPLNEEQASFLKNARLSCETLLSVVNDILDFSKVEAGKLTLEKIVFDPEVLCFDTIDVVRTKVDESKVELLCSVADSVPGKVIGDPHRFRQVLLNLLSNAVKFTEQGKIHLSLDVDNSIVNDPESENSEVAKVQLAVKISDTGIGIAKDQIDNIFKPFIQSEDDITNRYGGTGLGLAISKNIGIEMGGDLWAQSIENKGSDFFFTAIVDVAQNKSLKRVKSAQLNGKKVLLVTTSYENYKLFSYDFKLAGMDVCHIEYSKFLSFMTQGLIENFDIAVIDFGKLPKLDKEKFAKKILHIQPQKYKYKFIACSIPVPGIADIFHQAGFKGFLPKPIPRKKLFEMISYVMGIQTTTRKKNETESEIITAHLMSENKKQAASILLVEDNPVNQKMTHLMLSKAGYTIDIAPNGEEAVKLYTANPDLYDLIFMDINMPKMNGFDATRLIRSFETNNNPDKRIPILALTANVLDDFKQKCKDCGMDDFLTKPIKREIVFKAIQQWANQAR